jgi:hypothetical protein
MSLRPTRTAAGRRAGRWVLLAAALAVLGGARGFDRVAGAGEPGAAPRTMEPAANREQRRAAIKRGCEFILKQQRIAADFGFGEDKAVVALTALSVLALMSEGSTDGRGPYGTAIQKGLDFLLKCVEEPRESELHDGYFYYPNDNNSKMHGQGYATLALASALGTSTGKRHARIKKVLDRAVACIEQAQTDTGGFGYLPTAQNEHEGSVTVTVAQGLRAARDAGILVSAEKVNRGLHYLKRSQKEDGSFRYSLTHDRSSYALTAAALSSFMLYGRYGDREGDDAIERGFRWMMQKLEGRQRAMEWYYYGHFYAAWACWQRDGDDWSRGTWAQWQSQVYPDLMFNKQTSDGSFEEEPDPRFKFGALLPTAFAVLTLAIPDEALPIFER